MSSISALVKSWRKQLRRFSVARSGNVAVTFALAILPIMAFVGVAVDYSRANAAKAAMQAAIDATALMLSKNASSLTQAQMNTAATNYFNALFTRSDIVNVVVTPTYTTTGGAQLVLTGTGNMATMFMKVVGNQSVGITVSSTVKWGSSRLRVALVLDNTGSMADDGKITALKTATKNLLTQLQSVVTTNGDVYVSIIPFSKDVNLDSANYNSSWIDWSDWNSNNQNCGYTYSSRNGWTYSCTTADHSTWNGCVMDRGNSNAPSSGNYDQNVTAPTTSITATLYAAEQYDFCTAAAAMGLNYNWSTMTTLVNNMSPNGNTNQGIGLQIGWMSLVGGGPFTVPALDPNYQYQQIIILLTDGLNTQNRWYTNQTSIDNRQATTCTNIKNAGITLYTVQVNTGGDPTSTLLKNCATDTSKFYLLTNASDIIATFNTIGTALTQLRVAK